ncbi:J domain-containing protein [Polaromonas glacialis]|uniref:hypothetical protein n=1 Tax=Polaromonas glacialis TaxID=866564 RepID=UPI0012EC80BA|nr:hypothetical protein [Polaromonas glacialis]
MNAILNWPVWALFIAFGVSLVIGFTVLRLILIVIDRAYAQLELLVIKSIRGTGRGVRNSAIGLQRGSTSIVIKILHIFAFPFVSIWTAFVKFYKISTQELRDRMAEEAQLREIWEQQFRELFPSYRSFKKFFNNPTENTQKPEASGPEHESIDEFHEACQKLGLPENGEFSQQEFNERYRKIRGRAFPDQGGSNWFFHEITKAAKVIELKKGWS